MDAEFRRSPARPELDLRANEDLLVLIRDEIRRDGPITFARFMESALYAPELGYYTSQATPVGRGGDFLTAPETHPIFGASIARHVTATWEALGNPVEFAVREYGAGSGSLALALLAALRADEPELAASMRYEAVEISPRRREEQHARPTDRAPAAPTMTSLSPDEARSARPTPAGFVLANEFLDAFPVHVVEGSREGLREAFVDVDGPDLVERLGPLSAPELGRRLTNEGVELAPGQRAEIAVGLDTWVGEVAAWLRSGVIVVIDYGDRAEHLYGDRRPGGTLMAYAGHQALDEPLRAVGRQDLTAHVDFTAVESAAHRAGFTTLAFTTQASYLAGLGLEELLDHRRSDPAQTMGDYLALRSGLGRLLDPRHTGGFKVLILARNIAADAPAPPAPGGPRLRRPAA